MKENDSPLSEAVALVWRASVDSYAVTHSSGGGSSYVLDEATGEAVHGPATEEECRAFVSKRGNDAVVSLLRRRFQG